MQLSQQLPPQELARYSRQVLLPGVGIEGQLRLKHSRVLVIGAGGLGSPIALYLAAAGIGHLGIADHDNVELHNLHRQLLHSDSDLASAKTASARRRLAATNPTIEIHTHDEGITTSNALRLFSQYDVIIDGTDNFPSRYRHNDAAFLAKKPLVYGSIFQFEGQASVFAPHLGGPCYRCLFPEPPAPGSVPNCSEAGVIGALCGVIGSLQALEALKLILSLGEPLLGKLLVYDALAQQFRTLNLKRDPLCPLCSSQPRITALVAENYETIRCETSELTSKMSSESPLQITVQEAKALLDQPASKRAHLIDVREPFEHAICQVPGSQLLPMRQVPESISELPHDRPLLVMCHHGGRSMRVVEYLRANGFLNAINVAGGIEVWALEIDPSLQRY